MKSSFTGQSLLNVPSIGDYGYNESKKVNFVPEEWKLEVRRTMGVLEENVGKEVSSLSEVDLKVINRFFIELSGPNTWKLAYLLVNTASTYELKDCYEYDEDPKSKDAAEKYRSTLALDEADRKAQYETPNISEQYKWEMSEEQLEMLDYKPTKEHRMRLKAIAASCKCSLTRVWYMDYEIRFRKVFDRGTERGITTPFGAQYQLMRFESPDSKLTEALGGSYISIWMKVGQRCALAECDKNDPKLRCVKCKEAHYCTPEHQKTDWKNHKLVCKQQI